MQQEQDAGMQRKGGLGDVKIRGDRLCNRKLQVEEDGAG